MHTAAGLADPVDGDRPALLFAFGRLPGLMPAVASY